MANPATTIWEAVPHTRAKHEILRRYLGAWFAILGPKMPKIVYIDGFCGPGRYAGGEAGSPVIAIQEALRQPRLAACDVHFVFIDKDADRIDHLKSELAAMNLPLNFHVYPRIDQFEDTLTQMLDDLDRKGYRLAQTFAFIDPFGFKGVPFSVVKRLLKTGSAEVFVNFMVDSVNRFAEHPDAADRAHIQSLLGASADEVATALQSADRALGLRTLYQCNLREHARFVRYFEMGDRGRPIYDLFFAGNHARGHVKIKEAFWKVDPQMGCRFSDQTDPGQPVLFDNDPAPVIARDLVLHFEGTEQTSKAVISYVEDETPYLAPHARAALNRLEDERAVDVDPNKINGAPRKKHTWPEGTVIRF